MKVFLSDARYAPPFRDRRFQPKVFDLDFISDALQDDLRLTAESRVKSVVRPQWVHPPFPLRTWAPWARLVPDLWRGHQIRVGAVLPIGV